MKKRFFSLLLALCLCFSFAGITANAAGGTLTSLTAYYSGGNVTVTAVGVDNVEHHIIIYQTSTPSNIQDEVASISTSNISGGTLVYTFENVTTPVQNHPTYFSVSLYKSSGGAELGHAQIQAGDPFTITATTENVNEDITIKVDGTVKDPAEAYAGSTITVTAPATSGDYEFTKWEAAEDSESVTFAGETDAETTFTMPSGVVSVKAIYERGTKNVVSVLGMTADGAATGAGTNVDPYVLDFTYTETTATAVKTENIVHDGDSIAAFTNAGFTTPVSDDGVAIDAAAGAVVYVRVTSESGKDAYYKLTTKYEKVTPVKPGDIAQNDTTTGGYTFSDPVATNIGADFDITVTGGSRQSTYETVTVTYNGTSKTAVFSEEAEGPIVLTFTAQHSDDQNMTANVVAQQEYTITLNANGGTVEGGDSVVKATVNQKLASLPNATLDGKTFNGWYTAITGGTKITAGYQFTENSTIYAQWSSAPAGGGGGGAAAAANVTTSSATNGTVKVSNTAAKAGDKVTVTLTPSTGYEADTLTVKDKSGATVEATKNADGTYTFTMPAASKLPVSVSATFKKAETKPVDNGTGFVDVAADTYYADAVKWAVGHDPQITNGKDAADTFKPNDVCTRAEAVTFLYRAAGAPDVAVTNQFKDVASDTWYAKAVAWAVANGITNGKDAADTFCPTDTCSRAEIVTFLARYEKATAGDASRFIDVNASDWFAGSVGWAVGNGITNGKDANNTFKPADTCTRAEIVTFLYRDFVK